MRVHTDARMHIVLSMQVCRYVCKHVCVHVLLFVCGMLSLFCMLFNVFSFVLGMLYHLMFKVNLGHSFIRGSFLFRGAGTNF